MLVLDIHSGQLLKKRDVGDTLAVKFNPARNEIYLTQRESGKVLSLDGTTYALKKQWDIPVHPNSLVLSADGQTLFVTIKQATKKGVPTPGLDSVVRIDLSTQ